MVKQLNKREAEQKAALVRLRTLSIRNNGANLRRLQRDSRAAAILKKHS